MLTPATYHAPTQAEMSNSQYTLLILGRLGVHSDEREVDLGSNTEKLLRLALFNVLLTSGKFYPPLVAPAPTSSRSSPRTSASRSPPRKAASRKEETPCRSFASRNSASRRSRTTGYTSVAHTPLVVLGGSVCFWCSRVGW